MKKYFSVGEAAKSVHTTSETLRHYDRIGLVKPSRKDEWTNYRYYTEQDIVRLNTVRALQLMVSTIICLASNKSVVLLDEPVLGFDAIMRVEFYDMLTESFRKHPRIIIVSTHIIEEIAKTIQKLIIIDKGSVRFFDTLQSVETKAFRISGLQKDVEAATQNLNVIGQDTVGGLATAYIFDSPPEQTASLDIHPLSLQDFFIQMVGHKGGAVR